ncbi:hypothetical protein CSH63_24920 [Micromonospora tulbaghiae]|uniref:Uncharacterized protein n=1 Tax=Micromonospora tulbaghiae TaxID=479978 RepID=A0A386WQH4_9ACTN|nr:hypothetical protein [Micromonospora tulbaghiae]AYF30627.1 hypothetical protein CSH63_24920 [Micromonospora tulbaghiae]
MTDRELRPVGRFEWEQIVLRARLGSLIQGNGRGTRGGVSGAAFKAVALAWASHGELDGTAIYPGDATLAVEAEVGVKVAQAVKRKMIEIGLTEKVRSRSRRQHRGDEYRLTLPTDLLDVVDVLTPAALKVAAITEYEKRRGKRGGSNGPLTEPVGPHDVGGTQDPPRDPEPETCGGSDGTTETTCGGSDGTSVGGPLDRDTQPGPSQISTQPKKHGVRTALTGPRATEPEEPDSVAEVEQQTPRPTGCPAHGRALAAGQRPDGKPACPLCRRGAPPTPTGLAPVIPISRRSAS